MTYFQILCRLANAPCIEWEWQRLVPAEKRKAAAQAMRAWIVKGGA